VKAELQLYVVEPGEAIWLAIPFSREKKKKKTFVRVPIPFAGTGTGTAPMGTGTVEPLKFVYVKLVFFYCYLVIRSYLNTQLQLCTIILIKK
jgi:hypothetical protein